MNKMLFIAINKQKLEGKKKDFEVSVNNILVCYYLVLVAFEWIYFTLAGTSNEEQLQ